MSCGISCKQGAEVCKRQQEDGGRQRGQGPEATWHSDLEREHSAETGVLEPRKAPNLTSEEMARTILWGLDEGSGLPSADRTGKSTLKDEGAGGSRRTALGSERAAGRSRPTGCEPQDRFPRSLSPKGHRAWGSPDSERARTPWPSSGDSAPCVIP